MLCCQELPSGERPIYWPDFSTLPTRLLFDALSEGDPLELWSS